VAEEDPALIEYRTAVLEQLTAGVGIVTLGMALLIFLAAIAVVRHW
jgi:hypothetical protein